MRVVTVLTGLALLAPVRVLSAGYTPFGDGTTYVSLSSIRVEKRGGGGARYWLEAHPKHGTGPDDLSITFTAETAYDPASHTAQERIVFRKGLLNGSIKATMSCASDPWVTDVACTAGQMMATGEQLVSQDMFQAGYPLSARRLTPESRQRLKSAYAAAPMPPTPTPTPKTVKKGEAGTLKGGAGRVVPPTPTPILKKAVADPTSLRTPTPTPNPIR